MNVVCLFVVYYCLVITIRYNFCSFCIVCVSLQLFKLATRSETYSGFSLLRNLQLISKFNQVLVSQKYFQSVHLRFAPFDSPSNQHAFPFLSRVRSKFLRFGGSFLFLVVFAHVHHLLHDFHEGLLNVYVQLC